MPVALTYPGVYVEEVPSGVRTITSVGTSITAFVDFFRQGPMDRAVEIFGMADFERIFGGLDDRSEAGYAIAQFFLNGGSSALVVRCASEDLVSVPNVLLRTASVTIGEMGAPATPALRISAASAGVWGNTLRAEIDHRTADPRTLFNLSVTRYASDQPGAAVLGQERFLNLSVDPLSPRFVDAVVNADAQQFSIAALSTNMPAANGLTGGDRSGLVTANFDGMSGDQLAIAVSTSGVFNATLPTWTAGTVTSLVQLASRLEQAIRTAVDATALPPALGNPAPPCLTGATVHVATYPTGPATFTSHLVINAGKGDPARRFTDAVVVTEGGAGDLADRLDLLAAQAELSNVQLYELGVVALASGALISGVEGGDGVAPNADALVGAVADANDRGIYALRKADLFNLLCIPRAASIVTETNGEAQMQQIVSQAVAFCSLERAFFLLDIPQSVNTVSEIKDWLDTHANFRSRNAAVFFPRIQVPDPVNGFRLRNVGPSGTMAGVFARTDTERGVWKAPAGIEAVLRGVSAMDIRLTDMENGVLNPLAINCLRVFPIYGSVSWGARTLDGADQAGSEWKYTPIRRLALMLEESLFRGTKWVVFEPNDEPLWARVRLNVGAYMMGLFRQGAFQGAAPKDAFYVKCDAETTTQADRNLGIINIQVGFAPLKPAEFVVIKIQQIAGDL
jgi:phage tail sheath protein FI